MSFVPDFGLRLAHEGCSPEIDILLAPFELSRIAAISEDLFTSFSGMHFNGEPHAVSLDFGTNTLNSIKQLCPEKTACLIEDELQNEFVKGHTLILPQPIQLEVMARLGKVQKAEHESFIPLVVQSLGEMSR